MLIIAKYAKFRIIGIIKSNLPIVVINTNGKNIVDKPRIVCNMGIINNGIDQINCLTDSFTDYNGKISIEIRGSTSQNFPKKTPN